jgi:hypothetical protein
MGTGGAGLARYVVDAVVLEGRSAREVAKAHGISKSWIYELIARYRDGGYQALEPRSKRPRSCKHEDGPTHAPCTQYRIGIVGGSDCVGTTRDLRDGRCMPD